MTKGEIGVKELIEILAVALFLVAALILIYYEGETIVQKLKDFFISMKR